MTMSLPSCSFNPATVSAASPSNSVEFCHGSGSRSVREATYFWALSSTTVNGLSLRPGQTAKKSS